MPLEEQSILKGLGYHDEIPEEPETT